MPQIFDPTRRLVATLTIEELCQLVQDQQGYIVLADDKPRKIGDLIDWVGKSSRMYEDLRQPVVVIGIATHADWVVQAHRFGKYAPELLTAPRTRFYYRAVAE